MQILDPNIDPRGQENFAENQARILSEIIVDWSRCRVLMDRGITSCGITIADRGYTYFEDSSTINLVMAIVEGEIEISCERGMDRLPRRDCVPHPIGARAWLPDCKSYGNDCLGLLRAAASPSDSD